MGSAQAPCVWCRNVHAGRLRLDFASESANVDLWHRGLPPLPMPPPLSRGEAPVVAVKRLFCYFCGIYLKFLDFFRTRRGCCHIARKDGPTQHRHPSQHLHPDCQFLHPAFLVRAPQWPTMLLVSLVDPCKPNPSFSVHPQKIHPAIPQRSTRACSLLVD